MEGVQELAGNLKAELMLIRDSYKTGKISGEVALERIAAIKRYRELVQRRTKLELRREQCVTGNLFD